MITDVATSRQTVFHGIDPRVKIVVALLFSCLVAISDRFVVLGLALVISSAILALARVPIKDGARRLLAVNLFVLFLWFFVPFSVPGEALTRIFGLVITKPGVIYAAKITIKSNAIMILLIVLIHSTSILTLGHALHELRVPSKIIHLFFFTYRYIHVIHKEYLRLLNAMKVRAFRPRTNLHTYTTFAHLVGMILVRSADRAERVHRAMICRNFTGRFYSLKAFTLKKGDLWTLAFTIIFVIAMGLLECTTIR